jgi:hypothetical protein
MEHGDVPRDGSEGEILGGAMEGIQSGGEFIVAPGPHDFQVSQQLI